MTTTTTTLMSAQQLQGMGVALVTPFTPQGEVDYHQLGKIVDYQIAEGADFITVLGTTAETPTLSHDERVEIQRFVAGRAAGRVPLIIGIGGNCTATVIQELSHAHLQGYSAILSVAPYYNKPSQRGLIAHFTAIADASPLPVILYNVPGRTGVNILPHTVATLAAHPRIIGIKEASGSIDQAKSIIASTPADFFLLSGDDALTLPLMELGARGVISVLGNAYTRQFSRMVHLALAGHVAEAAELHRAFTPLYPLLFAEGNPAGVKCTLHTLFADFADTLRLPLVPVSEELAAKIEQFVAANPL